jgi:hypothetical protein
MLLVKAKMPWGGTKPLFEIRDSPMRMELPPCEVRRIVAKTLENLGAVVSDSRDLDETIIVSDGKYVARSYRVDQLWAMWLFEHGIVQFYDSDGTMLRTVNLFEEITSLRAAA